VAVIFGAGDTLVPMDGIAMLATALLVLLVCLELSTISNFHYNFL